MAASHGGNRQRHRPQDDPCGPDGPGGTGGRTRVSGGVLPRQGPPDGDGGGPTARCWNPAGGYPGRDRAFEPPSTPGRDRPVVVATTLPT